MLDLDLLGMRVVIRSDDEAFLRGLTSCFESPSTPQAREAEPPAPALVIDVLSADPLACASPKLRWRVATFPRDQLTSLCQGGTSGPIHLISVLGSWLTSRCRSHYVFHAAAVSRSRAAILMPAKTHAGKTTLTTALLRHGYELLSDEAGPVDVTTDRVAPYPRNLFLRTDTLAVLGLGPDSGTDVGEPGTRVLTAKDAGSRRCPTSCEPVLVVFPRFQKSGPAATTRLRPGPSVVRLMECACSQPLHREQGFDRLVRLACKSPCYELIYSDLDAALERIAQLFEAV